MALITIPAYHTANSYGTLEQAETYFTAYDRIASDDTWNLLTDAKKEYSTLDRRKAQAGRHISNHFIQGVYYKI